MRFAVLAFCCALVAHFAAAARTNEPPQTFKEATKGVSQKVFKILDVLETNVRDQENDTELAKSIADGFVIAVEPRAKTRGKLRFDISKNEFMGGYKKHIAEPCAAIIGYMGHDGQADHYRKLCMQIDEIQAPNVFNFVRSRY